MAEKHYGKDAHIDARWTFADKGLRDVLAANLAREGWKVKRYSSRNQLCHPMHVDDRKHDVPEDQKGFGNTIYKTPFAALYMVKIIQPPFDNEEVQQLLKAKPSDSAKVALREKIERELERSTNGRFYARRGTFKGHAVLELYDSDDGPSHDGRSPVIRFGLRKARALDGCREEIADFVKQEGE